MITFAENTQQQTDFDAAQLLVSTLNNGLFKTRLQARLDAIVIVPNSSRQGFLGIIQVTENP